MHRRLAPLLFLLSLTGDPRLLAELVHALRELQRRDGAVLADA